MNKEAPLKNDVYFLCSPSLGILDNWLPVIWRLKEKKDDLKFIIIFPKASHIDQIHLSNVLIILAARIFDSVVYKSQAGHWLHSISFSQLKGKVKSRKIEWFATKIINKLTKWRVSRPLSKLIHYVYDKIYKFLRRKELFNWKIAEKNGACILYDVYEDSKLYNKDVIESLKETPKFSIQHGININDGGIVDTSKPVQNVETREDVRAYLFSSKERPLYEHKYGIPESLMEVVGVPRHSPEWMEFIRLSILGQSKEIKSLKNDPIFIISRPGGTDYHPYRRKKKALEAIKQLAWEDLKKNIVIKLHPKEKKEGIYEEVFGTETYGDKWVYSELHPFVLGKASAFAISFYSGVPVDMLALGVPTIEYLDLREIPECDIDEALRDKMGHPVLSYRYLELVLGASDYDQMKAHAMEIMNDRETVMDRLQAKYNKLFPRIENVNKNIANDILNTISKKPE
jgi:hypothetical protein